MDYCELRTERSALLELLDRANLFDDSAKTNEGSPEPTLNKGREFPSEEEFVYYDAEPIPVTRVEPTYPVFAREAQIQGKVVLHVLVGKDGRVKNIKVIKGVTGLNDAAVDAVRRWVFRPAASKGEPVAVWVEVPLDFHY